MTDRLPMVGRNVVFLTLVLGLTLPVGGIIAPPLRAGSPPVLVSTLAAVLVFQRRFVTALLQGSVKG